MTSIVVNKLIYDNNGNLRSATDENARKTINYVTDMDGQILVRRELAARAGIDSDWALIDTSPGAATNGARQVVSGSQDGNQTRFFYYLNGHRIGDVSNAGKFNTMMDYAESLAHTAQLSNDQAYKKLGPVAYANFDENYQPINDAYPGTAPIDYTVQQGDTLSVIAAKVWGDAQMWYLIADANGLSGGEKLSEGMRLVIPNKVTNIHNNAGTFKVYDAGEAIGDTSALLPAPPPPPNKDCGGIGTLVMIAIAVAVTVYTAGAAASAFAAAGATGTAGAAAAAGAASLGGSVLAGTAGAAYGLTAGTMLASAAIGGAVGSIASQGFAMAVGMQDSFSWRQVGISALGSAITAGVGQAASTAGTALNTMGLGTTGSSMAAAGRAALSAGATMAVQGKWNWSTVMASAIGAGVGSGLSAMPGVNSLVGSALGNVAGQLAGPGGKVNFSAVLGSALGSAVSAPEQTQGAGPYSDYNYENEFDRQDSAAVQAVQRSQAIYGLSGGGARLGGGGTGPSWDSLVDSGISPAAVAMEAPDGFDGQFGGVTQGRSFVKARYSWRFLDSRRARSR